MDEIIVKVSLVAVACSAIGMADQSRVLVEAVAVMEQVERGRLDAIYELRLIGELAKKANNASIKHRVARLVYKALNALGSED